MSDVFEYKNGGDKASWMKKYGNVTFSSLSFSFFVNTQHNITRLQLTLMQPFKFSLPDFDIASTEESVASEQVWTRTLKYQGYWIKDVQFLYASNKRFNEELLQKVSDSTHSCVENANYTVVILTSVHSII